MLYSQHVIELGIDETYHKITIKQLSLSDKNRLKELRVKGEKRFAKYDDLKDRRTQVLNEFLLNEKIIDESGFTDKLKLLLEQKRLSKELNKIDEELKESNNASDEIKEELESYYKEMFDLCVVGEGKASLIKEIETKGFTYKEVFETMIVLVAKAMEKK